MKSRYFTALTLLPILAGLSFSARAGDAANLLARAQDVQSRIITIDTHVDIPPDFATDAYDLMKPGLPFQQLHIPTMIQGGLDAAFIIVFVPQGERNTSGYAQALSDAFVKFAAIHKATGILYPDKIALALSAADVRRIRADGKRAALIGMENGFPMGRDLRLLEIFYDYGARYFGLIHVGHNDLGDSSLPRERLNEPAEEHGGLTPLGRQVVERLNQLGIMVDVSHASRQTTLDIIAASVAPVITSHSGVKSVYDHPRNLSDEELLAIRDSGGVAQIVAFDVYLRAPPPEKTVAISALGQEFGLTRMADLLNLSLARRAEYAARIRELDRTWPRSSVRNLVDHIDYAVKLGGIDTVGIASDFNGGGGIRGWMDAGETVNVTVELLRRGYREPDIAKLWGGNLLRVLARVEEYAARWKKRNPHR